MTPSQLNAASFDAYPPEARALLVNHLETLRQLPLAFLPLLLRETISYDWRFPAERQDLANQVRYLRGLGREHLSQVVAPFAKIKIPIELEMSDWVNQPVRFSENLSAYLWSSHQMDSFRSASLDYMQSWSSATGPRSLTPPRLIVAIIGEGATAQGYPVFRKLRKHGTLFTNLRPDGGSEYLLQLLQMRARNHPAPFAHWYIDGARKRATGDGVVCISYDELAISRKRLLERMLNTMRPGGGGPELLRTQLAELRPSDVGLPENGQDALISRFKVSLLTEGSGTQIFSTTFVQWAAREALRRAQPQTMLVRFAARQRDAEISVTGQSAPDPYASLIDADMGAYYTWVNLQRLPNAERDLFVAWFEEQSLAVGVGSKFVGEKVDSRQLTMHDLLGELAA